MKFWKFWNCWICLEMFDVLDFWNCWGMFWICWKAHGTHRGCSAPPYGPSILCGILKLIKKYERMEERVESFSRRSDLVHATSVRLRRPLSRPLRSNMLEQAPSSLHASSALAEASGGARSSSEGLQRVAGLPEALNLSHM